MILHIFAYLVTYSCEDHIFSLHDVQLYFTIYCRIFPDEWIFPFLIPGSVLVVKLTAKLSLNSETVDIL